MTELRDQLPDFVANCVGEILESTNIDECPHDLSGDKLAATGTQVIF